MARSTLCQLPMTVAIAVNRRQRFFPRSLCRARLQIPSVPSDKVDTFFSRASICAATAPLRSRSSLRCSSSALFSSMRAMRAGDWEAVDAVPLGPRI